MTCKEAISKYLDLMQNGFSCNEAGEGRLQLITPFLHPDHDNIEVYVKDKGKTVTVHDYGETLRRLDIIGLDVNSSDRVGFQVDQIAKSYDVIIENGVLLKTGSKTDVGSMIFDLISVSQYVSSLAFGGRSYQPLTFNTQVDRLLDRNRLSFTRDFKQESMVSGKIFTIDFRVVTDHRTSYVQVQDARSEAGISTWINATFRMWTELKTPKKVVARNVTLFNDEELPPKTEDVKAMASVSDVYLWSERDRFLSALGSSIASNGKHRKPALAPRS